MLLRNLTCAKTRKKEERAERKVKNKMCGRHKAIRPSRPSQPSSSSYIIIGISILYIHYITHIYIMKCSVGNIINSCVALHFRKREKQKKNIVFQFDSFSFLVSSFSFSGAADCVCVFVS